MRRAYAVALLAIAAIVILIATIQCASALTDFTPSGNINMRGRNITNATMICFGSSCQTSWSSGGGNATFNQTLTDSLYLNKTDQRYNDTTYAKGYADSVGNWSADKSSYNTITQANSKFLQNMTCASGYVLQNATTGGAQCVLMTVDTDTWNTTAQMRIATNNSLVALSVACGNITGATSNLCTLVDTNSGGTSNLTLSQINANMGNYSANPSGFISSVPYQSSAAGWTNTTTTTTSNSSVIIDGGNNSLSALVIKDRWDQASSPTLKTLIINITQARPVHAASRIVSILHNNTEVFYIGTGGYGSTKNTYVNSLFLGSSSPFQNYLYLGHSGMTSDGLNMTVLEGYNYKPVFVIKNVTSVEDAPTAYLQYGYSGGATVPHTLGLIGAGNSNLAISAAGSGKILVKNALDVNTSMNISSISGALYFANGGKITQNSTCLIITGPGGSNVSVC